MYLNKLLVIIIIFSSQFYAQLLPGAHHISLAGASLGQDGDVFSIFYNPAGIAINEKRSFGLFYSPAPFGLSELKNGYLTYIEPTKFGNIGLGIKTFGFELYKENELVLTYSNNIDDFYLGFNLNYNIIKIKNYSSENSLNISIGGIYFLTRYASIGFSALNLLRSNTLPNIFSFGISIIPVANSSLFVAVTKENDFDFEPKFGLSYTLLKFLQFSFGIKETPSSYSAGLGFIYSIFNLNFAINSHQQLGLTQQFDLIIKF